METKERSFVVTGLLCVGLFAGNWFVWTSSLTGLSWVLLWPVAFIVCIVIAARIWHGHNSL